MGVGMIFGDDDEVVIEELCCGWGVDFVVWILGWFDVVVMLVEFFVGVLYVSFEWLWVFLGVICIEVWLYFVVFKEDYVCIFCFFCMD